MKQSTGLIAFLKGSPDPKRNMPGCANFDHYYGGCLLVEACVVEQGNRCAYFEKAVLPTGDAEMYEKYEQSCGIEAPLPRAQLKRCECGAILKTQAMFCSDCLRKRRQMGYRRRQSG